MDVSECQSLYEMVLGLSTEILRCKARQVVDELHEGGFVHGDVRDTSLLIDHASLGKAVDDVKIDFDFDLGRAYRRGRVPDGS
jgi:hypothetical protein